MKTFTYSLAFLCLPVLLSAQAWSWGLTTQVGRSGYSNKYEYSYSDRRFGGSEGFTKSKFSPSVGLGLWAERAFRPRWSLTAGLDYRMLNEGTYGQSHSYDATGLTTSFSQSSYQLTQHLLALPVGMRYYLARPQRSFRPFFGAQIAPSYVLGGRQTNAEYFFRTSAEPSVSGEIQELDYSLDYALTSRLQVSSGIELGVVYKDFALSFTKNWTFRADQANYDYPYFGCCDCIECNCDCIFFGPPPPHLNSSNLRILRNYNLKMQYRL